MEICEKGNSDFWGELYLCEPSIKKIIVGNNSRITITPFGIMQMDRELKGSFFVE